MVLQNTHVTADALAQTRVQSNMLIMVCSILGYKTNEHKCSDISIYHGSVEQVTR